MVSHHPSEWELEQLTSIIEVLPNYAWVLETKTGQVESVSTYLLQQLGLSEVRFRRMNRSIFHFTNQFQAPEEWMSLIEEGLHQSEKEIIFCNQKKLRMDLTVFPTARYILFLGRDTELEESLHRKYKHELLQKEGLIQKLSLAHEELKKYSEHLNLLVEERTKELQASNRLIRSVLNSIEQGLFLIDHRGFIKPPISKSMIQFFPEISHQEEFHFFDILEPDSGGNPSELLSWLESYYHTDWSFEDLQDLYPQKFKAKSQGQRRELFFDLTFYELEGKRNKKNEHTYLVGVLSNTTLLKSLESNLQAEIRNVSKISLILQNFDLFSKFYQSIEVEIPQLSKRYYEKENLQRYLHSIKSGFAQFGFEDIVQLIHQWECELKNSKNTQFSAVDIERRSEEIFKKWRQEFEHSETLQFLVKNLVQRDSSRLNSHLKKLLAWLRPPSPYQVSEFQEFKKTIEALFYKKIGEELRWVYDLSKDVAHQLSQPIPEVIFSASLRELFLYVEPYEKVFLECQHLVRNAVDHGFTRREREDQKSKSRSFTIFIDGYIMNNFFYLSFSDNGQGLDLEKLSLKAQQSKEITPYEKAHLEYLIFHHGLSTKNTESLISGMGVGLSSLKSKIEELGGRIFVYSSKGRGTKFLLQLPLVSILHVKEELRSQAA